MSTSFLWLCTLLILFVLGVYWVLWKIWLTLESNLLLKVELWGKIPGAVRRPKFWQFAILTFWLTNRG